MRTAILATSAVVLALSLTACGGSDPKSSAEYKALASKLSDTQSQLAKAQQQVGNLPQEQASLKAAQDQLDSDQAGLATAEQNVSGREKTVEKREKAVKKIEGTIAANTIPGDGTYKVGGDMNPGTYKSIDNEECYWQLSSDANGNDIIANNNVNGQAIISARTGEYFQSQDCSDWHKIG
jgi:hypothetical protein